MRVSLEMITEFSECTTSTQNAARTHPSSNSVHVNAALSATLVCRCGFSKNPAGITEFTRWSFTSHLPRPSSP